MIKNGSLKNTAGDNMNTVILKAYYTYRTGTEAMRSFNRGNYFYNNNNQLRAKESFTKYKYAEIHFWPKKDIERKITVNIKTGEVYIGTSTIKREKPKPKTKLTLLHNSYLLEHIQANTDFNSIGACRIFLDRIQKIVLDELMVLSKFETIQTAINSGKYKSTNHNDLVNDFGITVEQAKFLLD